MGPKENWRQFTLLVIINAFVGGMTGMVLQFTTAIHPILKVALGMMVLSGSHLTLFLLFAYL